MTENPIPEETPEVTPELLRAHAAWLRVAGRDYIADEIESLADLAERRRVRQSLKARERILLDLLAEAFRDGQRSVSCSAMMSYEHLGESMRAEIRGGVRGVLEVLPTLSSEDLSIITDAPSQAVEELTEALRLSVEYVGVEMLPPVEGWSWYDTMVKYAPDKADRLRAEWERLQNVGENGSDTVD